MWISIKDKLPEQFDKIDIISKGKRITGITVTSNNIKQTYPEITHWMPEPKLPFMAGARELGDKEKEEGLVRVKAIIDKYIEDISKGKGNDFDMHYIAEAAISAFYSEEIWEYINNFEE